MANQLDIAKLSERERTVLLLAADGLTDKEIASNLGLSLKTVHTYWDRMRQKFDASTRTQVFAKFLRIEIAPGDKTGDFERLFATWEEGVWLVGSDGETIYANRRISETFGYDESEFLLTPVEQVFDRADAAHMAEFIAAGNVQARSTAAFIRTRDGARVWISFTATPWVDDRGQKKAVVLLVRNETLKKRVEHALNSCVMALDGVMEVATDCICKFDGNLKVQQVNPSFLKHCNTGEGAVVGKNVEELTAVFTPNQEWVSGLRRALQTGERQEFSVQISGHTTITYLLPEPSAEFLPLSIMSITLAPGC